MKNREKKYSDDLAACRKSIGRTKKLIEYHKNMLKTLEDKEKELSDKLNKEKFSIFLELVTQKGYDIDKLRSAVVEGDFSRISTQKEGAESMEISIIDASKKCIAEEKDIDEKESFKS